VIRNMWYAVLESREIRPGRLLAVRRFGEDLVFWRSTDGVLSSLKDRCAHRGVRLSAGRVTGDHVECPFHGIRYDAGGRGVLVPSNGRVADVPKGIRVTAYPVREAHGFVFCWWGECTDLSKLPPVPWFDDLPEENYRWSTALDPWETHYSRAVENQLDVAHLPFVHYNTIGRGCKTMVNGPLYELSNDELRLWVHNERDEGGLPRPPEELQKETAAVMIYFIFPNLWQNCISDKVRVMIAFVPVDDERTLLYVRFYQGFARLPLLGGLICRLGNRYNLRIAHQDRQVVVTQVPKRTDVAIGENLVQADRPIVAYRRRRRELIESEGDRVC